MKDEGRRVLLVTGDSIRHDAQAIMAALAADHGSRVVLIDACTADAAAIATEAMTGTVDAIMICDDVMPEMRRAIMDIGTKVDTSEPRDELLGLMQGPSIARLMADALKTSCRQRGPSRGDPVHNQAPRSYRGGRGGRRP